MKRILCAALMLTGISTLISCSNGDYTNNVTSPANQSVNPLKPLTASEFTWSGAEPLSVKRNGSLWHADSAWFHYDSTGAANLFAYETSKHEGIVLHLLSTYAGNLYNMGFKQYNILGYWMKLDSAYFSRS